jgi:hypothetical protein
MLLLSRLRVVEKLMMMIVTFTVVASSPTSSSSRDGGEGGGREMGANRSTKTTCATTCARTTKTGCAPHHVSFFCGFLPVVEGFVLILRKSHPKNN